MKRILDKKKWMKVADAMKIPKQVGGVVFKIRRFTVFPMNPLFRLFRNHNSCCCATWGP